jgi:hypothetical protein
MRCFARQPPSFFSASALDPAGKILKEQGICLEELVESGRDIRGEMVEEDYGLEGEEDH